MKYLFIAAMINILFNSNIYCAEQKENIVIVFGCFDLFHEGHKNFIQQAASYGKVIAIVTRDAIVAKLKKRSPCQKEELRLKNIQIFSNVFLAILGDEQLGTYVILQKYKPDLICLGYDQKGLYRDLKMRLNNEQLPEIPMVFMQPYQEDRYHTSILREQLKW